MRGEGRIYQRGGQYWIDYHFHGRRFREPAGESDKKAKAKLKDRMKQIHGDRFVGPAEEKLTVDQLADNLITHLETRGAKSVPSFKSHLKPVKEAFALVRVVDLTTARIEQFIKARLEAKKKPATINRETGALPGPPPRAEARSADARSLRPDAAGGQRPSGLLRTGGL